MAAAAFTDPPVPRRLARWSGALLARLAQHPFSLLVSLVLLYITWVVGERIVSWGIVNATFVAEDRSGCDPAGACWAFIVNRLPQFAFGFYPEEERWRALLAVLTPLALMLLAVVPEFRGRRLIMAAGFCLYPLLAFVLLAGGLPGLPAVSTERWGGLTLTMLVGMSAFVLSFPIAILLALARTSSLPALRLVAAGFIEFWRGLPLVAILFMSVIMLPLFLPPGVEAPRLSLALAGITFYSAAYLAEVVRGGLQGIGRGQYEAAGALGFGFWNMQGYVVLPQALRSVVPAIVNTAIALFKDTTYVMVVGLFDLLNIVVAGLSDANWIGLATEGYVFVGVIYWTICFGMSRMSARFEGNDRPNRPSRMAAGVPE